MNTHRFLFYLFLVLLPTQLTKYFFPEFAFISGIRVDYLAPVIYATDILIIGIVSTWIPQIARLKNYFSTKTLLIICLCIIGAVLNSLIAINPLIAFLKWVKILEYVFLIFYIRVEKPTLKSVSIFLLAGGTYSCLLAWLQFIHQSSIGGIFWWIGERTFNLTTPGIARLTFNNQLFLRPYATLPHPNVLAGFLTCLIPIIFYIKNVNRYTKLLFIPTLVLFLSTILISFSQIAWIVALTTTLLFVFKEKRMVVTKQKIILGILILASLVFVSYQFVEKESISRRIVLIKNAVSIICAHPLFGVGLNNFIVVNQQQTVINSYQDLQPVHSIYLLLISETGISGILLIGLALWSTQKKVQINKMSFYVIWPVVTLLVFGLFDHYPFTIHQTLLLGAIFTGCVLSTSQRMINLKHGKRSQ